MHSPNVVSRQFNVLNTRGDRRGDRLVYSRLKNCDVVRGK